MNCMVVKCSECLETNTIVNISVTSKVTVQCLFHDLLAFISVAVT